MKKGALFLLFILLITLVSSVEIDKEISENLIQNKEVNAIITYKENPNQMSLMSTKNILDDKKILHSFDNKISTTITEEDLEELKDNSNIESIRTISFKQIFMQDSIYLTNSTEVWPLEIDGINLTGKYETACVLDTGTDFNHPDLQGKNLTCVIDCASASCVEDCSFGDPNGHGTHVAGIIGANGNLKGIAPEINLISVAVCNSTGSCRDDWVRAGIDWCVTNSENYNISIISMSLGGGQYTSYCDGVSDPADITSGINNAVAKNITVTAATGNTEAPYLNPFLGISSPACIQNSTRITALNKDSSYASYAFRYSFFTDILATFGTSINSTYLNNNYASLQGTSMSTPMAAGIVGLLKQYKKLESNKTLTSDEVKEILLNSSTKLYDSGTSSNYSKINPYFAIFYADEQAPNITSMLPINNSLENSKNQSFSCNATDLLQFANLTIEIYNETSLVLNETISEEFLEVYFNTTLGEDYNWSCVAVDNNSNTEIKTFFLTVSPLKTHIISPSNNTYTKLNQTVNCSVESSLNELSNLTFYFYNSTNLINSSTVNISGMLNSSIFDINFTEEGAYYYDCIGVDNESQTSDSLNYTIYYDITIPNITLSSPANNTRTTSKQITFSYNYTDNSPNESCTLIINGVNYSTFTQSLTDGAYYWNITCSDKANNTNNSDTYRLEIYTESSTSSSSGGGGGGGGSSEKEYSVSDIEMLNGVSKKLRTNDKIKFKSNNEEHQLTLNKISTNNVIITVQSNPITFSLNLNNTKKLNLNNDDVYDLEVKLNSIDNLYANITIKNIYEEIPVKHIFNEEESNKEIEEVKVSFFKRIVLFIKNFFRSLFLSQ